MRIDDPMTVGMVAGELGLSRGRVHQKLQAGDFPGAIQLSDGTWLIPRKALDATPKRNPGRPKKASK